MWFSKKDVDPKSKEEFWEMEIATKLFVIVTKRCMVWEMDKEMLGCMKSLEMLRVKEEKKVKYFGQGKVIAR